MSETQISDVVRAEAVRAITVRQCDIDRLKKRLAKARFQRNEWRRRAEAAEETIRSSTQAWVAQSMHKKRVELEDEIRRLNEMFSSKMLERIRITLAREVKS